MEEEEEDVNVQRASDQIDAPTTVLVQEPIAVEKLGIIFCTSNKS